MRGFVVIFQQRKIWRLGLQGGNSSRAKAWSPWRASTGKGEKEDLEDKVSILHHRHISASSSFWGCKRGSVWFSVQCSA